MKKIMVIGSILLMVSSSFSFFQSSPKPPKQPATGPGGAQYLHSSVSKAVYGSGEDEYWLYEPADPKPEKSPVIVFNHGWSAMNPGTYGAWIEHIARRGNIVIYPRYQADLRTPTKNFTPNAIRAIKDALNRLQSEQGHVRPDLDKLAVVGHSAGGQVTANIAALAKSAGIPKPKAIMSVQPGKSWNISKRIAIPLEDMSQIPDDTLLLAVVGEDDKIARDVDAKRIFNESTHVPASNKNYVILVSDNHGSPALMANHFAPVAFDKKYDSGESRNGSARSGRPGSLRARLRDRLNNRSGSSINPDQQEPNSRLPDLKTAGSKSVDALDYYGLWKLFDGLCDAAFYGKNRDYALGDTPEQRFMGKWSDGVPVKELVVVKNP